MADLKLDTLIKVLLMTTSDNNSEALAAVRRANVMLRNASTDWEKLLRGKVTVVADPFADIAAPQSTSSSHRPTVPQRPQYVEPEDRPAPPAYYIKTPTRPMNPATPRAPTYSPQVARRNNTNNYAGRCFNCNVGVAAGYGALRDIQGTTRVFCEDCNFKISNGSLSLASILNNNHAHNIKKQQASSYSPRTKRKVTTADLMADIFTGTTSPTPKPSKQADDDIPF